MELQGEIVHYSEDIKSGSIHGVDGISYRFREVDCKWLSKIRIGQKVKFLSPDGKNVIQVRMLDIADIGMTDGITNFLANNFLKFFRETVNNIEKNEESKFNKKKLLTTMLTIGFTISFLFICYSQYFIAINVNQNTYAIQEVMVHSIANNYLFTGVGIAIFTAAVGYFINQISDDKN